MPAVPEPVYPDEQHLFGVEIPAVAVDRLEVLLVDVYQVVPNSFELIEPVFRRQPVPPLWHRVNAAIPLEITHRSPSTLYQRRFGNA
jgi:hypothetical protein